MFRPYLANIWLCIKIIYIYTVYIYIYIYIYVTGWYYIRYKDTGMSHTEINLSHD